MRARSNGLVILVFIDVKAGNKERGEKVSILIMRIQEVHAQTDIRFRPQRKGVQMLRRVGEFVGDFVGEPEVLGQSLESLGGKYTQVSV